MDNQWMDNTENLATLGTQYTNRTKTNKILKKHITINKQTQLTQIRPEPSYWCIQSGKGLGSHRRMKNLGEK
jgi:hypothetical protein